jgi:hypothetical protein
MQRLSRMTMTMMMLKLQVLIANPSMTMIQIVPFALIEWMCREILRIVVLHVELTFMRIAFNAGWVNKIEPNQLVQIVVNHGKQRRRK